MIIVPGVAILTPRIDVGSHFSKGQATDGVAELKSTYPDGLEDYHGNWLALTGVPLLEESFQGEQGSELHSRQPIHPHYGVGKEFRETLT